MKNNEMKKKEKKKEKKDMRFGFFMQPSKFLHTLYLQYKDLYLSRFQESRPHTSYMSLAIDVAR